MIMKLLIFMIPILFIACARQGVENNAGIEEQLARGKWESSETPKTVLTFEAKQIKAETITADGKSFVYRYDFKITGENQFIIDFPVSDAETNTKVEKIEGKVKGKEMTLSCVYEKIDKSGKSYPARTDEPGLCAYHNFQKIYE